MQTSSITVAVLSQEQVNIVNINEKDLEWKTRRGSGPGGQHRNKTESTVDLLHIPTGIRVTADSRSQHQNKIAALASLKKKLLEISSNKNIKDRNNIRQSQIGQGMRGEKRRTIRVQDNQVIDHILNKTMSYKEYQRGNLFAA